MAQQTTVRLVDDLDGTQAAESIPFGIDGKHYEIDLNPVNAARLRDLLAPFLSSARKAGNRVARATGAKMTVTTGSSRSREETQAIRQWAQDQGIEVSDRGRIAEHILAGYRSSQGQVTASTDSDTLKTGSSTPDKAPEAVFAPAEPKTTTAKRKPSSAPTEPPAPGLAAPTMQAMVAFRESRGLAVPKTKQLGKAVQKATTGLMADAGLL